MKKREAKKRKIQSILDDDDGGRDKVYKFQVLLPNGVCVAIVERNPFGDMPLERFVEMVREKFRGFLRETEQSKQRRRVIWNSEELYLEDALGNRITNKLCFDKFKPNKIHILRLYDGGTDQTVNTFENMWDLTPDTDLLTELPEDYTFETALADLVDNSLQAVWSNGEHERKLISVEVHYDQVSVFDTGPGMDATKENSIMKWGKMGASVHRSSKKLAIGGRPPYLTPFFGMFGYGGTIASMHLGRHAVVSAKTKESKKVYWLHLERDALLRRSGSDSDPNWKTAGGIRDPLEDEIEKSPHKSFTKVDMKPKLKIPNIFQLQCKLKNIYFPYIQCDEISKAGKTTTLVEFQVNGINLAEIDGGEVAITNLHSCNGPDFVLNLHFYIEEDNPATKSPSIKASREANARLKCVYFPIVEGKENIERILEKLNSDGCVTREDFETFSRISIRRLGRLLPDARWDLLPFMKPKQKRGDRLQILKRCCLRVKCFIDTDAGFNPIPSKTDLAPQHPFTKALKDLGSDHLHKEKEVKVEVFRNGKKFTLAQLEKEYQDWVFQMHSNYDEEVNCGDDEPVMLVNASNKEALGIKSDVVRVHRAMSRKGRSWVNGQRIKILKGACPGFHKSNTYATLEYLLLEGFQGDLGGEARIICRPLGVPDQNGCKLTVDATRTHLELHSSLSLPIVVIDKEKCIPVDMDDWNVLLEKLNLKAPSTVDVLGLKQCKELDINGALPTETQVSAGSLPPKEVVAVLRPLNFSSSSVPNDLDQKYIIRDNYEMCMEIKLKPQGANLCKLDLVYSGSVTNTSRKGVHGLYVFDLTSVSSLFQKAGVYSFSFSLKNSACKGCEVRVQVKASSTIKRWELLKDDQYLKYIVRAGSCFPSFSVARFDMYDNCVPFQSVPEIVAQLVFDGGILCHIKKVNSDLSSNNFHMIVRNARITTSNLDKIRPSYEATLVLFQPDKVPILRIPCRVMPGPLQSVIFHPSESRNGLLPKQVVLDAKLEMFDRHGNHVKQGTKVDLAVHGFCLMDQNGVKREADNLGCVDLGGVLKVTGAYGESVSLSVLSDKDVIFTKKFRVQKRELTIATDVPEPCRPGSMLKDIAFEVVNSEGEVDQTIHDEDKHSQSHTLTIKTDFPNFDNSLRYAFRHGCCVIPSIALPRREGSFYIEAVHSHHKELHLKFKVNVSQAMYTEYDADLHVSGEVHDEGISQPSDEEMTPLPVSFATENVVAVPQSQKKVYAVVNPVQPSRKEKRKTMLQPSEGKFMLHRDSLSVNSAANSVRSKVQDKQGTPTKSPLRQYDPSDELNDGIFQSPEGKIISLDCFTPQHAITQIGPHLWDLQDVEKEIYNHGLEIKEYEEDLKGLQIYRDATVLKLQASTELQQLDRSDYMSQKEVMSGKIENKVGSAAAVYSISTRDMTLKEEDLKIMANMVGIVACLGTTASPLLSRLLAEYLGENKMLAIVCQSFVTTSENYERALNSVAAELGKHIKGSYLLICLEDIRPYVGDVRTSDPKKRLDLPKPKLPDGKTPPGFLGYAVNMIEIDVNHLETKTAAGFGLRETLFYGLFGELQVYDCKENMKHARSCTKDGAVSLDGGIIRGNGIISLGCKQVDVHFPVAAVDHHRLIVSTKSHEIIRLVEKKKAADEAIAYTCEMRSKCMKQFQESQAGFLKLLEEKEASSQKLRFSHESLKISPMTSQTPAHY